MHDSDIEVFSSLSWTGPLCSFQDSEVSKYEKQNDPKCEGSQNQENQMHPSTHQKKDKGNGEKG